MLGVSAQDLNNNIARCLLAIGPSKILEYGCGTGKLGVICQALGMQLEKLEAVQTLFQDTDREVLHSRGYTHINDAEIYSYIKGGIKEHYDVIAALDVIEHFMYGDAISIIDYSLYRCNYFLMVWPSRFPIENPNPLETHRTSFDLRDITNRFDVCYYSTASFSDTIHSHRLHIALLRGHNNFALLPSVI